MRWSPFDIPDREKEEVDFVGVRNSELFLLNYIIKVVIQICC